MSKLDKVVPASEIRKHLSKTAKRIWCPGCGTSIALGGMIRAMVESKIPEEAFAVITGIGCTGRAHAYVDYDSLQTPHGRTLPVATGIKLARPKMHLIVFSGDGDLLGIGGNHFIHAARRNIGITVVLVNNFIYGMTGGQVAPTTPNADKASTAPYGNLEAPFDTCALALAAGATYVARTTAYHVRQMVTFIGNGIQNEGFSVIEVLANCTTQYGRWNRKGSSAQMLKWFQKNSVSLKKAAGLSPEKLSGKYITGEFAAGKRTELSACYLDLIAQRNKERVDA
jgi:2-oxoglutarate ferredoxin oxidoreductase subunit beta